MPNREDVTLNGVKYRIRREAEGGGYQRSWIKQKLRRQDTDQQGLFISNPERMPLYQTKWQGGTTWWKPLMQVDGFRSYNIGSRLNAWEYPGELRPMNVETVTDESAQQSNALIPILGPDGTWYGLGATDTVNPGQFDMLQWATESAGFTAVNETPIATAGGQIQELGHMYDPTSDAFYLLTDTTIYQWGTTGAGSSDAYSQANSGLGFQLFKHFDKVLHYNGDTLVEIENISTTPGAAALTDDGFGDDYLLANLQAGATASPLELNLCRLAISTSDGIYYVKNVLQNDCLVAYVYRVERDAAGIWAGVPIATINDVLALDIIWHLGSLLIAATPDVGPACDNDANQNVEIALYHVTGGNMGLLGSVLGPDPDETPWKFLGTDGPVAYIGSNDGVWVYDGVAGGIHKWIAGQTPVRGPWHTWVKAYDKTANKTKHKFTSYGGSHMEWQDDTVACATVTTFDSDLTTYVMESNYFDYGLPMEDKSILGVHVQTDAITDAVQWAVYLSVDDGAYAKVVSHSNQSDGYSYTALATAKTGKRFRYKLVFETKTATLAPAFRAIQFEASSGKKTLRWNLSLDGTEFLNVEGGLHRPEDVYDNIETLGGVDTPVAFVDNFRSERREDASTYNVEVQKATIVKSDPHEAYVDVVLDQVYP